ncbi:hypothetical protein RchiOBHm_Chr2g0097741 [Rosa chinensis]|uniref:Non-specific serine/threonine protein kinase n=1 Tax=Rosa chinensis TaxID=74649 RepID=A0A2P6RLE7_ROSCH|nr:hypothetical protein RchiOBHm_Chr2g0097741 [Rosa chinensis]
MSYLKLAIRDLSSSGLTGEITSYISHHDMLHLLTWRRTSSNGSLPSMLIEKLTSGSLLLRAGENENLCAAISCKRKKANVFIPIIAAVGGFAILFAAQLLYYLA